MTPELIKLILFPGIEKDQKKIIVTKEHSCGFIKTGAVVCVSCEQKMSVFPIVNGILVLLPPERLHVHQECILIRNLLAWLVEKHPEYEQACRDYAKRMQIGRMDEKMQELAFYEKMYHAIYQQDRHLQTRYGDHWYTAVRDVLSHMRSCVKPEARILEIAGGHFAAFPSVFSPEQNRYVFVGTEISYWGLMCGTKTIPGGQFIQVDSDDLNFENEIFDIIFIKGALHHQAQQENALPRLLSYLKRNGMLGFTEVVRDRRKPNCLARRIKTWLEPDKKTSPMNESIDKHKALAYLRNGSDIISLKERMSIIRYALARLLAKQKVKSLFWTKFIVWVDDFVNKLPLLNSYWLTSTHIMSVVVRRK